MCVVCGHLEGIVRVHAGLRPEEVSPADIHLVKHRHVLGAQTKVPDLEVFLDAGWGHGLKHYITFYNNILTCCGDYVCEHDQPT